MLMCSGVSRKVLDKCPEYEKTKHISIGASVLFTALLAVISSYFAFSLIFTSIFVILFLSVFWGLIIFNLDRFIIATLRKRGDFMQELLQVSPRLFLSIAIAIVISKPLELQIFKSEIDQSLQEQMMLRLEISEKKHLDKLAIIDSGKKQFSEELRGYFDLKEQYYQDYKCECDGTCGTGKFGSGVECQRKRKKYEDFLVEYQGKERMIYDFLADLELEKEAVTLDAKEERDILRANFSFGLLARLQALHSLKSFAPWAITLVILFVEVAPVFTKLFTPKGPYDELLAIDENNFRFDYIKNLYQNEKELMNGYANRAQELKLIKREHASEKEKMVKELYKDLSQELNKHLNN